MCYQEHIRFKIQINQLYAESTKQWCRDGDHVNNRSHDSIEEQGKDVNTVIQEFQKYSMVQYHF